VWFELAKVEAAAPDQASLKAARALAKTSHWPVLGSERFIIWGECQGSGANPYQVVVDAADMGYRCSCPSRKFPCKHSLALMIIASVEARAIAPGTAPEWVSAWLGRRRGSKNKTTGQVPPEQPVGRTAVAQIPSNQVGAQAGGAAQVGGGGKLSGGGQATIVAQLGEAAQLGGAAQVSVAAPAKRSGAAEAKLAEARASTAAGLDELDDWIVDQLKLGLTQLMADPVAPCRRIAARLVDHKASTLASRLDEFPSRLLALPPEQRPHLAVRELGQLVLLARAWRADPAAPDLARAIGTAESRARLLENPAAQHLTSQWEVAGSRVLTRRDRLVSHATWLINLGQGTPFGLLQDYYPASQAGSVNSLPAGRQMHAEVVFYPGRWPLRAVIASQERITERLEWPNQIEANPDPLERCRAQWDAVPWETEVPMLLAGVVTESGPTGQAWWTGGKAALPLAQPVPSPLIGSDLMGFGIWDGARFDPLVAQSQFGPVWI
jgi:hypothetical protein